MGTRQGREQHVREVSEGKDGKCRGWRLAKALFEDLHVIQRAQDSHRKY